MNSFSDPVRGGDRIPFCGGLVQSEVRTWWRSSFIAGTVHVRLSVVFAVISNRRSERGICSRCVPSICSVWDGGGRMSPRRGDSQVSPRRQPDRHLIRTPRTAEWFSLAIEGSSCCSGCSTLPSELLVPPPQVEGCLPNSQNQFHPLSVMYVHRQFL